MRMKKRIAFLLLCLLLCGCGAAEEKSPEEPEILLEGERVENSCRSLSLQGTATPEELRTALDGCPQLERVFFESCPYTPAERAALLRDYPAVRFDYPLQYGKTELRSTDKTLDLSDETVDVSALCTLLEQCADMECVELGEHTLSLAQAERLAAAAPHTLLRYDTELFSRTLSTDSEEIDLSGIPMKDTAELERELLRFPRLKKVILCECGLDDETMDALNRKYEDIRFVWTVQVYNRGIRTDQDYFILYNCEKQYPTSNGTCAALRYCSDLTAVDLGHMFISNEELQLLYSTPKIRYLVAMDGLYTDITPMGSLQELEYLEMFSSQAEDLSPLKNCKKLKHLNISRCHKLGSDCIGVLCSMKQLERLWFVGTYLSPEYEKVLQEALPDTEIHFVPYMNGYAPYSMDYDWRKHESYYAMRDALHMYYMDNQK